MEFCSTLRVRNYCLCVSAITKIVYLFTIFVIVCKLKLVSEMFYVTLKYTKIPDLLYPYLPNSLNIWCRAYGWNICAWITESIYLCKYRISDKVIPQAAGSNDRPGEPGNKIFINDSLFLYLSHLKISKYKENGAIFTTVIRGFIRYWVNWLVQLRH